MGRKKNLHPRILSEKYPPSDPCSCTRPGWWRVEQAGQAIAARWVRLVGLRNRYIPETQGGIQR